MLQHQLHTAHLQHLHQLILTRPQALILLQPQPQLILTRLQALILLQLQLHMEALPTRFILLTYLRKIDDTDDSLIYPTVYDIAC